MKREDYDRMWIVLCLIVIAAVLVVELPVAISRMERIAIALEKR